MDAGKPEAGSKQDVSFWRTAAYLTSAGWMIALPIAAGVLLGRAADGVLGTRPYGTLVLLALGIGVAVIEGWMAARRALTAARPK